MQTDNQDDGEISVIALLTTVVRNVWTIVALALAGALLAGMTGLGRPLEYRAIATFQMQIGVPSATGLASLAGQLGLASGGSASASAEFYKVLMESPVLLSTVVKDTFVVPELGGNRMTVYEIFGVSSTNPIDRELQAMASVRSAVSIDKQRVTNLIQVTATTPWPSVSLSLVKAMVNAVDAYNREGRRSAAAVERRFIEARLAEATAELRAAEDQLQRFLAANRLISPSSVLAFEQDRLERVVTLKNQLYTTFATSYEDVRIREVRDTPVVSIVEPPRVNRDPEPRRRVRRVILGAIVGGFLGLVAVLMMESARRVARVRAAETAELRGAVRDTLYGMGRLLRLRR